MKRTALSVLVAFLVIGGAGYAWGSAGSPADAPLPPKPTDLPGDQAVTRAGAGTRGFNDKNATVSRVYQPLATPCRLYDSRSTGGILAAGSTRTIPLTACPGIPSYATALDASISTIAPQGPGFLRAWANGAAEPSQTLLQWGGTANTAGATVNTSGSGVKVHVYGSTTHVAVDVAGYYHEALYVDLLTPSASFHGEVYSSTGMVVSSVSDLGLPGQLIVTFARSITRCDIQATAEVSGYIATAVSYTDTQVRVQVTDAAGTPARAYASVLVTC